MEVFAAVGLKVVETSWGNWRDEPGLFFQDIVVLEKTMSRRGSSLDNATRQDVIVRKP